MNAFSLGSNLSFRGAELQRFNKRLFISKYELCIISIKEQQFLDRENTVLYIRKESSVITIMYGV
jgi:hypothetical protein